MLSNGPRAIPTIVRSQSRVIRRQSGVRDLHHPDSKELGPPAPEGSSKPVSVVSVNQLRPLPTGRAPSRLQPSSLPVSDSQSSRTPLGRAIFRGKSCLGTVPAVPTSLSVQTAKHECSPLEEVTSDRDDIRSTSLTSQQRTQAARTGTGRIEDWMDGAGGMSIDDVQATFSAEPIPVTLYPLHTTTVAQKPPSLTPPHSPPVVLTAEIKALKDIELAKARLEEAQSVCSHANDLVLRLTKEFEEKLKVGQRLCSLPLTADEVHKDSINQRKPSLTDSERERIVQQIREGKDSQDARWREASRNGEAKMFLVGRGRRG